MNVDTGVFEPLDDEGLLPNGQPPSDRFPIFAVGDEVEIRGQVFVITKVARKHLVLKPARRRQ